MIYHSERILRNELDKNTKTSYLGNEENYHICEDIIKNLIWRSIMVTNLNVIKEKVNQTEGFSIFDRGEIDIVGYVHNGAYHYVDDVDFLECRFSKFDKEGNMICRPMEKFFNFGDGLTEKFFNEDQYDFGVLEDWFIYDKYDGSLINSYIANDELVFGTKMGVSEVSQQFVDWFVPKIKKGDLLVLSQLSKYWTINMEFISPDNRIVVEYDDHKCVILSMRNIETGEYMKHHDMKKFLKFLDVYDHIEIAPKTLVSLNEFFSDCIDIHHVVETIKGFENIEGYILEHVSGFPKFKVKTDWYLERHGLVEERFRFAKTVKFDARRLIGLLIEDDVDDILSYQSEETKNEYNRKWFDYIEWEGMTHLLVCDYFEKAKKMDKKSFAQKHMKDVPLGFSAPIFKEMEGDMTSNEFIEVYFKEHAKKQFSKMKAEDVMKYWEKNIGEW